MNTRKYACAICMCAVLGLHSAFAMPEYTIYGAGGKSCGDYLSARNTHLYTADEPYESWLNGYLTADSYQLTLQVKHQVDLEFDTDLNGAMYWLGNFCNAHPTAEFATAVSAFAATQLDLFLKQLKSDGATK